MQKSAIFASVAFFALAWFVPIWQPAARAQTSITGAVVFAESGFPSADSAQPSSQEMAAMLPGSKAAGVDQLAAVLASPSTQLLILAYGSAFPEEAWPGIKSFLDRGGNLLVLGGMPFTRAAYRDHGEWRLRNYSVRFIRQLMIDQYQQTPGSEGLQFQSNSELTLQVQPFAWKRAFSAVIRLSAVDLYHRGGTAGSIDARLDSLAWGVKDGRRLSAPAIQVDHYRNGFDGGRWILVNADLSRDLFDNAGLLRSLAQRALQGAEEFTVRPVLPLYLPGEPIQLQVLWQCASASQQPQSVKITTYPEGQREKGTSVSAPPGGVDSLSLP